MSRITDYILEPKIVYTEGGFLVRVKVQDDYKYKKYIVSENLHYKTVQGTSFTLTDASSTKQASITELKGNTSQEGTPTPSSPVEVETVTGDNNVVVSNKNLFDVEQSITKVENRAGTVDTSWGSYENGIVTMNRNNGQNGVRIFSGQPIFLCSNKTYTLSVDCFLTGTATANGVHFGLCDLNNSNEAIQENNFSLDAKETWQRISLTVTPTQNYLRVGTIIQALNGGNVLQMKNIQIEQGGQATTYIEHEGNNYNINLGDNSPILPIDYQEVEYIESTGTQSLDTGVIGNYTDNLTIKTKLQLLKTKGSENAIMGNKNSSNQGTTMFFPQNSSNLRTWCGSGTTWNIADLTVNEDTEIEISFTVPSGRNATINNTSYTSTRANNVTSNDTTFAIFNDKPSTVLSPSFLRVYYYEIYIDNVKKCQLIPCYRKSDNVIGMYDLVTNTFKTHIGTENFIKGNNVYHNPIELCKIGNYQDKLYYNEGKWYIEKNIGKVVLNGQETWSSGGSGTNAFWYTNILSSYISGIPKENASLLCTHFKYGGAGNTPSSAGATATSIFFNVSSGTTVLNGNMSIPKTNYSAVNDLKNELATNTPTLYYPLATPTYTEITDTYLLNQLNGILDMELYENLCYVDWVGSIEPTMTLQYAGTEDLGIKYIITEDGKKIRTDWRKLGRRKKWKMK